MLKYFKLTAIIFALSLTSCASKYETIYKTPPAKYENLGRVSGSASGALGFLIPPLSTIPLGPLNSRTARAYENALSKAPGATSLINVTYQESWTWWLFITSRTLTISGDAIKEIK